MKKKQFIRMISAIIIFSLLAVGCAKKSEQNSVAYDMSTTDSVAPEASMSYEGTNNMTTSSTDAGGQKSAPADGNSVGGTMVSQTGDTVVQDQDKIIRTFYLSVETQEFDSLLTRINSDIKRLNGYVESSNINGKSFRNNGGTRYGEIIARVPSEKVDEFVGTVNEDANVIQQQESTENVSLQYIEAESRVETLKIEQDRLFAILEKENELDSIITLESRLSDIRYELSNYESQLRYYDNKVAYSTVTMSIQEVEKLTPVTEEKQGVTARIKNGLSETFYNLSEFFKNLLVWFIVNLPYLIIWGILIIAVILITKHSMKKRNAARRGLPGTLLNLGHTNQSQNNNSKNSDGQSHDPGNQV